MLLDALDDWREVKTITVYGWARLNSFGPSLIMPNATVDRIVDAAHHHKIRTIQELKKETGWTDADQFGTEVISIIEKHAAPPSLPFASTPLRPSTTALNTAQPSPSRLQVPAPSSGASKRRNKCSACGEEGHNGKSSSCQFDEGIP